MLQAIRDRVTGIVAIFVLGLLAIPFVFFGLDSYIQAVPQDAVAEVGDSEITVSEFQTEFSRYRARLRQQQGDAYDELQANRPEARREFLESMIDRRLLSQHAEEMGLSISPNTIADMIREIPAFQAQGRFDPGHLSPADRRQWPERRVLRARSCPGPAGPGTAGRRHQFGFGNRRRCKSLASRADGKAKDFHGHDSEP